MSYYGPSFDGIDRGWYRHTKEDEYAIGRNIINAVWSKQCDDILRNFVLKYGTYFTAFIDEIIKEIDKVSRTNLIEDAPHYWCYLANRAYEIEYLRAYWIKSHKEEKSKSYNCILCNIKSYKLNSHPTAVQMQGLPLKYCRDCIYIVDRCKPHDEEIKKLISKRFIFHEISKKRNCDICNNVFSQDKHIREYRSFGTGGPFIDYLYPNLFADICPKCFFKAFYDQKRATKKTQFVLLHNLFELIGKIPTQNFGYLFYLCRDRHSIINLIKILHKLRTPEGFKKMFGSFFAALVHSGILPNGVRKTAIGITMLAEDGHVCFSKTEKEIDDYLCKAGIRHKKEVKYPGSERIKADWELFGANKRIFIEYFGLINQPEYAKRAEFKKKIAIENNIILIEIYPKDNWKENLNHQTVLHSLAKSNCSKRANKAVAPDRRERGV